MFFIYKYKLLYPHEAEKSHTHKTMHPMHQSKCQDILCTHYESGEGSLYEDYDIFVTRFNSLTYNELERYKDQENKNGYSIYGCSRTISTVHNIDKKLLFVLEMNNTLNKIVGIGIINNIISKTPHHVYSDDKYNGVYYASPFHIKVDYSLSNEELNFIHYEFERSVFYGKSNLKRGQNLCKYPDERIKYKHLMFLLKLYASKNPSNVVDKILMKKMNS